MIPLGHGEFLHCLSNPFPLLTPPTTRVQERILNRQHGGYGERVLLRADVKYNYEQERRLIGAVSVRQRSKQKRTNSSFLQLTFGLLFQRRCHAIKNIATKIPRNIDI